MPESVGAPGSSIDLAELVQETIGQYAYFGSTRDEQSDYRREALDDMLWRAEAGTDVHRNSYLKAFLREGVSGFPFADYVYLPSRTVRRVPSVEQYFIDMQDPDPLPIWRPEIFVNCRYSDLTDEECFRLLLRHSNVAQRTTSATNDKRRCRGELTMSWHSDNVASSMQTRRFILRRQCFETTTCIEGDPTPLGRCRSSVNSDIDNFKISQNRNHASTSMHAQA